ncbi:hypothetical protein [Gordonia sp. CPCC 205333]|uniref:hypothetical protein n=1 Tax=Gordonia sp. CPCC 205333 TaxID=3140790 RepID=UPI003AF38F30
MSQLADALDSLVDLLRANGVHATTDGRDLNPPAAWVTLHDVTPFLGGTLAVRGDVCLIVGDFGSKVAIAQLGDLLDKVAAVVSFDEPARPMTVTLPGQTPMPALAITTTIQ